MATSADALRGYTPTILVFDEAAYIEAGEDFWAASMASLSTGGKIILISTPNGFDPIYYGVYDQAIRGVNDFHITDLRWFKDPRYTKDLRWVKCSDIVHYMLNREQYDDNEVVMYDFDIANYKQYEEDGYKPLSSWFEAMSKKFKFDRRKIAQELECDFLGSGDGVIPSEVQDNIVKNMIRDPKEKYMQGTFWQWKEPIQGHKYIMGVDVSRGDSEDFSSINIIDFDEREQVAEYVGKLPPDNMAEICYKWGSMYSAYIVVDITGGMGVSTSRKLQEMGYKNLYIDGVDITNKWKYVPKSAEKIPGINFNNKRVQIIASYEEALRHGFKIYSNRLFNEMNTFVYINGRPDHQKGHHDDLIMSIAMATYVAESSFTNLTKVSEQAKIMIESWSVSNNDVLNDQLSFNPVIPNYGNKNSYGNQEVSKNDYIKYGWLFGRR